MDKKLEEAIIQTTQMHFRAFQRFLELTGGQIELSLQLTSSWMTATMNAGANKDKEKESQFLNMFDDGAGIVS